LNEYIFNNESVINKINDDEIGLILNNPQHTNEHEKDDYVVSNSNVLSNSINDDLDPKIMNSKYVNDPIKDMTGIRDYSMPKKEDIEEAMKKREHNMTKKSERIQSKWLKDRKENDLQAKFKRNCKMKGSFMIVEY